MFKKYFIAIALVMVVGIGFAIINNDNVSAQTASPGAIPLTGWAWSSNIGWISMGSSTDPGGGSYGVYMEPNGNLVGYAWSSNIGWIKFGDLSGFPSGSNSLNAQVSTTTGSITGMIRACAGTLSAQNTCNNMTSRGDGWDGWIELSGTNHTSPFANAVNGVSTSSAGLTVTLNGTPTVATGTISGFAWGGPVVGWTYFNAFVNLPTAVTPSHNLTVVKTGTANIASSTITMSPAPIKTCASTCTSTTTAYSSGTSITLTVATTTGTIFDGWYDSAAPSVRITTSPTYTFSLTASTTIFAKVDAVAQYYRLLVNKLGSDNNSAGTATSSPVGINCGPSCNTAFSDFPAGNVTLFASPSNGSIFRGWYDGIVLLSSNSTYVLNLDSNKVISARFGLPTCIIGTPDCDYGTENPTLTCSGNTSLSINQSATLTANVNSPNQYTFNISMSSDSPVQTGNNSVQNQVSYTYRFDVAGTYYATITATSLGFPSLTCSYTITVSGTKNPPTAPQILLKRENFGSYSNFLEMNASPYMNYLVKTIIPNNNDGYSSCIGTTTIGNVDSTSGNSSVIKDIATWHEDISTSLIESESTAQPTCNTNPANPSCAARGFYYMSVTCTPANGTPDQTATSTLWIKETTVIETGGR